MSQTQTIIIAHSHQQYDKCQRYLKGEVPMAEMYPLMITYYQEILNLYQGKSINHIPDTDIAETFCNSITPPQHG